MFPSVVHDLKAFVPARDYELSLKFYQDIGFTLLWRSDAISEFSAGESQFLLQNFWSEGFADNFMLQLVVDDADAVWSDLERRALTETYPEVSAKAPALQPWGLRVLYLTDPSGVLWHIVEKPKS